MSPERPKTAESSRLFREAEQLIPGGVNSPVRAFGGVGGTPRFIARAQGAWLTDADGNRLLDLVGSWGPMILGHAHPDVVAAITAAAERGTSFGAPAELESQLARRVIDTFPSVEMVRFVSSGTEAVMSAVRLARAATGRRVLVKFEGCYHGHADALLASAGSGVATLGLPDSPGVPPGAVADTAVVPYNALDAVAELFARRGDEIAAVIVEPVAGNMGVVPPAAGFLGGLRDLTTRHGALLIFDEVMTGWRVHPRGAHALYGVMPDLTVIGKVVGGGLPAAAYGGARQLMEHIAPAGPVYQAGTLSGNPLAMAAGLATLEVLERPTLWEQAANWAASAQEVMDSAARAAGVPLRVQRVGTMFTPFFSEHPVTNYADARGTDRAAYARFFHAMLDAGVYLPPSPFEAAFSSAAHGHQALEHFGAAVAAALPGR
ncbi:MAG TPA: glutamate-1-semialdehyde 2,1-aminomutase [Gemmatimonadales bacterium]|nr:glutamate-1-semialdehyde 2,1-aminomutase [Gemmatimonadales bacterium]